MRCSFPRVAFRDDVVGLRLARLEFYWVFIFAIRRFESAGCLRPGLPRGLALLTLLVATTAASACTEQDVPLPRLTGEPQVMPNPEAGSTDRTAVVLTGVRVTQGNAVDCPQLRDDAGNVHVVSALSGGAQIGARIEVRGFYGVSTKCIGTVLIVQEEKILSN